MLKRVLYNFRNKICRAVIVPIERKPLTRDDVQIRKIKKSKSLPIKPDTHVIKYELFYFKENEFLGLLLPYRNEMDSTGNQQVKPPSSVKGMMKLDRSKFDDVLKVPTVIIPIKKMHMLLKKLKKYGLKLRQLSPVVALEKSHPEFDTHKRFLLDPRKMESFHELPETVQTFLDSENSQSTNIEIFNLKVSYENWNFHEIMQAIMPDDHDIVSGFSEVGHIAHFNLRDEVLPYKDIIGKYIISFCR